jgi:MFS family permease
MTGAKRALFTNALLVFASVLSTTLLIPAVRPFMASLSPKSESAAHAFMALSLLGAVVAAPFARGLSVRFGRSAHLATALALSDVALLACIALSRSVGLILALRLVQGGLNVTLLSLLLGACPTQPGTRAGARYGFLGAAMMLGVALGSPLGALGLRFGARAPLAAACLVELLVVALVPLSRLEDVKPSEPAPDARPWLPMAWVFAERLSIGLFVVTFAFHGRQCLGLSDSQVGFQLSAFMVPFVLAVHPAARLGDRLGSPLLATVGLSLYGVGWFALRSASNAELPVVLVVLGLTSSAVFAAAMREAGAAHGAGGRVQAMSALNSAGSLGMLIGTALAGILSAVLRARGADADAAHGVVFITAGALQLSAALLTAALPMILGRGLRLMRN